MARFLCIACEIFARPIYFAAAASPHVIDVRLIERGLHDRPEALREHLQKQINQVEEGAYQAVLLGYGLCGNGTAGLQARSTRLVLPRVHDCIGLLLGGRQCYNAQFSQAPGTYWYSRDFIERKNPSGEFSSMGPISDAELSKKYDAFVEKFGQDNADYLMEVMGKWQTYYQRAAFIETGILDDQVLENEVRQDAAQRGWTFDALPGDLILIRQLLNGDWEAGESPDFIIIPPFGSIELTYDENIFKCGCA